MAQASLALNPSLLLRERRSYGGRGLLLLFTDSCAAEISLLLGILLRQLMLPLRMVEITAAQYQGLFLGILALPIAYHFVGMYRGSGVTAIQRLRGRVEATSLVFGILIFWDSVFQTHWSRGILVGTFVFCLALPAIAEATALHFLGHFEWFSDPVVVLGAGRTGALLSRILLQSPELGMRPVAFLDDDHTKWGTSVEGCFVVGPLSQLKQFKNRIRTVIVAMPGLDRHRLTSLIDGLSLPRVVVIPDLFGIQSLWVEPRDFGGVLGLELKNNLLSPLNRFLKRVADYALGVPLLLASLPVVAICAILIRSISRGSPFFSQEREGMNGRIIRVWKLRTMYDNADDMLDSYLGANPDERLLWERFFKLKRDPRILPVIGRLLRRTSLDELPQFWNVLRGDMSLVGPRPFPIYHQERFPSGFRNLRCSVLPGVTGIWQIGARSNGDLAVQETLDTYYIRNWSLWMDLYILAKTVWVVFFPNAAC